MVHKEHPNVMSQKSVLQVMRSRAGEGCVFGLMTLLWWDVHGLSLAEGPGGCWGGADPRMSPASHCQSQACSTRQHKGLGEGWVRARVLGTPVGTKGRAKGEGKPAMQPCLQGI